MACALPRKMSKENRAFFSCLDLWVSSHIPASGRRKYNSTFGLDSCSIFFLLLNFYQHCYQPLEQIQNVAKSINYLVDLRVKSLFPQELLLINTNKYHIIHCPGFPLVLVSFLIRFSLPSSSFFHFFLLLLLLPLSPPPLLLPLYILVGKGCNSAQNIPSEKCYDTLPIALNCIVLKKIQCQFTVDSIQNHMLSAQDFLIIIHSLFE